jgi:hypothetical protein
VSRRSCCGVQEQEEEVVGVQEEEQQGVGVCFNLIFIGTSALG